MNRVLQALEEAPVIILVALNDLNLEVLYVVYPGLESYRLHEKVKVLPIRECVRLGEVMTSDFDG
jgi:hypothetical protein